MSWLGWEMPRLRACAHHGYDSACAFMQTCVRVSSLSFFNSITRNQGDVTIRAGLLTMLKGRSLHTTPPNTVANTCLNIHQLNVQSAEKMKSVKSLVSHNEYRII